MALLAGLLVVPALVMTGCGDSARQRSSMDSNIKNAKLILADLKATWASGHAIGQKTGGGDPGGQDDRLGLVAVMITEKVPYMIQKKVSDDAKKKQLNAKVAEITKFIDDPLAIKYVAAKTSNKPEDAKALVSLADQLDKKLDELDSMLP
jgi:hypothetical protein